MEKHYIIPIDVGLWFQIYFPSNDIHIFHKCEIYEMAKATQNRLLFSVTLVPHSHAAKTKLN